MASSEAPAATLGGEIVVYETEGGEARVDVRFDRDSVWLTQRQMADLFETSTDNISLHLTNIFSTQELEREATTEDSSVVRTEGSRQVRRTLTHYNLDAIISVGYRVNSRRGVRFRQWATRTLRDHLVRGFTLNQQRLAERGLQEARDTLDLLASTLRNQALVDTTGQEVLDLIAGYADTWRLLLEYDENQLTAPPGVQPSRGVLHHDRAAEAIARFQARTDSARPSLVTLRQSAGRRLGSHPRRHRTDHVRPAALSNPARQRRRICSTSSSRTIPSPMATSASVPCCSCST